MIKIVLIGLFTIFLVNQGYSQDHDYSIDKGLVSVYHSLSNKQIKEVENLIQEILVKTESSTEFECKVFVSISNENETNSSRRSVKKLIRKLRKHFGADKFETQEAKFGEPVICKIGVVIG